MLSTGMNCARSGVLRQIAVRNNNFMRNLLILGLTSVTSSQVIAAKHLANLQPVIGDIKPGTTNYSTAINIPVVQYAEIKDLPNHPEKFLIDVRKPDELKETGQIPKSINIPLDSLDKELKLSSAKFRMKYGRAKPDFNDYIIVHCRSGKRAQVAAESLVALCYKKVHNYVGSWNDWAEREHLPKA